VGRGRGSSRKSGPAPGSLLLSNPFLSLSEIKSGLLITLLGRRAGCRAQHLPFVNYAGRSRRLHHHSAGRFKWIRAWKTAFASAHTRSGLHMVACTAKPLSIGLRRSGKSWRHQRLGSPANRPRKRSAGRLHVRRPPERSRWPANAAHHARDASAHHAHSTQHER
jgi:hypothetical protein